MTPLVAKSFIPFIFCLLLVNNTKSQSVQPAKDPSLTIPPVFLLGEYEQQYEEIVPRYSSLLEACNGDMQVAFGKLMSMMKEMEAYGELTGYNLKDINAWMHFFWRKDGTIEHIGFYLKPNSRNVNPEGLKNFLAGFAKQYKFPLNASSGFSHYSSFSC